MNAWAATALRGGRGWTLASRLLLVVALAALTHLVVRLGFAAAEGRFAPLAGTPTLAFALAGLVYLAGHGFRTLRLALLMGGWRIGVRRIASFQLMTAAVSLMAPLKLGEVYRVVELSHIAGGFIRAIAITWWERAFDVAFILLMLVVTLAGARQGDDVSSFLGVAILAAGFVAATAIAFFALPENLSRLSVLIIRRYDSARAVPVLRALDLVRRSILEAPGLVRGKVATLAILTALVWACEIACFAIVTPSIGSALSTALDALLSFMSALVQGETLLAVLHSNSGRELTGRALPYLAAAQAPLAILGLGAGLYYARWRLRS